MLKIIISSHAHFVQQAKHPALCNVTLHLQGHSGNSKGVQKAELKWTLEDCTDSPVALIQSSDG